MHDHEHDTDDDDDRAEPGTVVGKQGSDAGDEYLADDDRPDLVALTPDVVTPRNSDPNAGPVTEDIAGTVDADGNLVGTRNDAAMYQNPEDQTTVTKAEDPKDFEEK